MKKDIANGTFLEDWPTWLRWVLFLPAAVIVPLIFGFLLNLIWNLTSIGRGEIGFLIIEGVVFGSLFVHAGSHVAPKYQFAISIILLILISVASIFGVVLGFMTREITWFFMIVSTISIIGGAVYMVTSIKKGL